MACPVCRATARRLRYDGLDLDGRPTALHGCAGCGAHYVSPRLVGTELSRQYTDRAAQERYYREMYAPIVEAVVRRSALTVRLLEGLVGRGTLLDYGSGAGTLAAAAERAGWRAIGYDVSPVAAEWGRRLIGTEVVTDWEAVTASGLAPFDAVALIEVVEHLERPVEVMRHAVSALRPGGILIVSTPNFASLARIWRGARWRMLIPHGHIVYLDRGVMRTALRAAGVRPLTVLTWGNELGRLPAPRRWARWLPDPPGGPGLLAFARAPG